MDQRMEAEATKNKEIRGYIIRSLVMGSNNSLMVQTIANALAGSNYILVQDDIGKHLDYLRDKGYIELSPQKIRSYEAYRRGAVIRLTPKGVDLVEGTIEDAGVLL